MNSLTTIAIAKVVSDRSKDFKAARAGLIAGEHEIDTVVRLKGKIVVEDDQEIAPTASILNVESLLLILKTAGVTREAAMRAISSVASEYLVNWTGSDEDKKAAKEARKEALAEYDPDGKGKAVFDEFKSSLPKIHRDGKVVCKAVKVEEFVLADGVQLEKIA